MSGTLSALLRAAPMVEPILETSGFATAATRRAVAESAARRAVAESTTFRKVAESARLRERWSKISPKWRVAGVAVAAAAVLVVAGFASLQLYQGDHEEQSEQVAASSFSATPQHHRRKAHRPSNDNQLALNEKKSLMPGTRSAQGGCRPTHCRCERAYSACPRRSFRHSSGHIFSRTFGCRFAAFDGPSDGQVFHTRDAWSPPQAPHRR